MTDATLFAFGCAVSFIVLAGIHFFLTHFAEGEEIPNEGERVPMQVADPAETQQKSGRA
jgi:hypothetical protein